MTTQTATAKMIYADQGVANQILNKLAKRNPQDKWAMTKLPHGFQVSRITMCPPAQYAPIPANPASTIGELLAHGVIETSQDGVNWQNAAKPHPTLKDLVDAAKKGVKAETMTFKLPFQKQTPKWIYFVGKHGPDGVRWIFAPHLTIAPVIADGFVTFTITKKKALEIGLIHAQPVTMGA